MDALRPKLIYLTRRNPTLSPEAFTSRWRRHGGLGMSLPRWRNIARYVHCDVLHTATGSPEIDTSYDGIGLIWHRSLQARAAHLADTSSRAAMERDEAETFAAPIGTCCVLTRETVLIEPRHGSGASKLTSFQHALPASADADPGLYRSLADAGARVDGHVINTPLAPETGPWGLAVDRVEEWWFPNLDMARRAAPILHAAQAGNQVLVLTNEVVLYGQ
jgi:hypothetical protein